MKKKYLLLILGISFFYFIGISFTQGICCEKVANSGFWCQDAENCDPAYGHTVMSCDLTTAICQIGTCVDANLGVCNGNAVEKECTASGGVWYAEIEANLPECTKGCCVNTGNILTERGCEILSQNLGYEEVDFKASIKTDKACLAEKNKDDFGACVLGGATGISCKFVKGKICSSNGGEFHKGFLCTDRTEVNAGCNPSGETMCVDGKEGVYFKDTCNQPANIYDSSKKDYSDEYWSKIISISESCNSGESNTWNVNCGNCNLKGDGGGSTCAEIVKGKPTPVMGEYICRDMNCESGGKTYVHGAAWCENTPGINYIGYDEGGKPGFYSGSKWTPKTYFSPIQKFSEANLPGSEYGVSYCLDGVINTVSCEGKRQEICANSMKDGLPYANCNKKNEWDECVDQVTAESCEDLDKDCYWHDGTCSPIFQPGFDFMDDESDAEEQCAKGSTECHYSFHDNQDWGGWVTHSGKNCVEITDNAKYNPQYRLKQSWIDEMTLRCNSLGDCGGKSNFQGIEGVDNSFYERGNVKVDHSFWTTEYAFGVAKYNCLPWQPPKGSENCQLCGENSELPCSEYQCESLGSSCKFFKEGEEGACVGQNQNDNNPPIITPNAKVLSNGYSYEENAQGNVEIVGPCLRAGEKITFGITLDELASCKYTINDRKSNYAEMGNNFFDGRAFPRIEHTQTIQIPYIPEEGDEDFSIYVRCEDASNGNSNLKNKIFQFCVEPGINTAPVEIVDILPKSGSPLPSGQTWQLVKLILDRSAECNWSKSNVPIYQMENVIPFSSQNIENKKGVNFNYYEVNLTDCNPSSNTNFYFNCKNNPGEEESYRFALSQNYQYAVAKPSPLLITMVEPDNVILTGAGNSYSIELKVQTLGGAEQGYAICYFNNKSMISEKKFENTEFVQHKQILNLGEGVYNYTIRCTDFVNEAKSEIKFNITLDGTIPLIARAYNDNQYLKIITNEEANCVYSKESCTAIDFEKNILNSYDKINHFLPWDTKTTMYIGCKDLFGNYPIENGKCSIILRAQE